MFRRKLRAEGGILDFSFCGWVEIPLASSSVCVASLWKLSAKSIEPILIYASVKKRDVSLSR